MTSGERLLFNEVVPLCNRLFHAKPDTTKERIQGKLDWFAVPMK
jgi:hypothetical protein